MYTKIVGHRGYKRKYPENTLLSFQKAIAYGANSVELDVHLSKDDKLIIHHDYSLGDPDNGNGFIFNRDSEYIKSLKANTNFQGEKIPLLEEVFKTLGTKSHYEIEMKGLTEDFVENVMDLVRQYNLINFIEFTSPHNYLLSYLKNKYLSVKTGMFVYTFPDWMSLELGQKIAKANAIFGNVSVLHCPLSILTKDYINELHNENLLVHAADCNTEADLFKAYTLSVDQLSSDDVALAVQIRNKCYEK